jgi:hypothetical protein
MFVFGVVAIEVWDTQFPVWAFVLALMICAFCLTVSERFLPASNYSFPFLAAVYTVPIGVIQAITNQQVGLNVITELIIGYALPGRPVAMMLFKTWGYITMVQALQFTSDFKLGHYMKIAPRPMFFCQIVATVVAGTVQLGVQAWMFSNIEDLCSPTQKDGFICPATTVFGTASIVVSLFVCRLARLLNVCVCLFVVGCDRATASVLERPAVLWPRILLPGWRRRAVHPVGIAQEVQDRFPQVPQPPGHLYEHGYAAARDAAQLCALGARLLCLQLRHPPAVLWLVVQIQLCVFLFPSCMKEFLIYM